MVMVPVEALIVKGYVHTHSQAYSNTHALGLVLAETGIVGIGEVLGNALVNGSGNQNENVCCVGWSVNACVGACG